MIAVINKLKLVQTALDRFVEFDLLFRRITDLFDQIAQIHWSERAPDGAVNDPPGWMAIAGSPSAVFFLADCSRSVPNFVVLLIGRLWYKRNDLIRGCNPSSGLAKRQRLLGTSTHG